MKSIIVRPIITEKSLSRVKQSQYTFEVEKNTNKYEIAEEVKKQYKVNVLSVRTLIRKGKTKQVGKKKQKKEYPSRKFAICEIKKGETISEFNQ
jgi:large subunit ribosomal protein L23